MTHGSGHIDHHVVRLARGHEDFALHPWLRRASGLPSSAISESRASRRLSLCADDGRHVHAQAGVHQAHQHAAREQVVIEWRVTALRPP